MDGLEATQQLRKKEYGTGRHQAVVAMTALVMQGDRERCLSVGMDGYLSKPIRPQELDEVLDSYLAKDRVDKHLPEIMHPLLPSVSGEELLERIDGDREFLSELIELFKQDYPSQVLLARKAIGENDAASLQRVAHTLKGALGNLAAPVGSGLAVELESLGKEGDLAVAGKKLSELEAELPRVVEALQDLCLEVVG
jgi:two-component system sensor histidine kinase/response regulator